MMIYSVNSTGSGNGMSRKQIVKGILFTLTINGIIPLIVYNVLCAYMSSVMALSVATVIPLLDNVYSFIKHRRLDAFAIFMLVSFALGLIMVALGGDEQLILLRESLVTGFLGLIFLGSLLFPRPLIYYFAMRFTAGGDPDQMAAFAAKWQYPQFRSVLRTMTAVWGLALVGEAAVRTALVFSLTINEFLAVSNFVMYGFIGGAVLWTVYYRKAAKKKFDDNRHTR